MKPALEQRQAVMRERFKSGLPQRVRFREVGTQCAKCRTAFVPNPDNLERTELCGLCKVRAKKQTIQ